MTEKKILEDIILNEDELGLAESLIDLESPLTVTLLSGDEVVPGAMVYFGVDLPLGDIGEVKGRVLTAIPEGDLYLVTLEVLALDSRYKKPIIKVLTGESAPAETEDSGVLWGLGLKQTNGAFAALINTPAGLLNAAQLEKITAITAQGAGLIKLTHAQRVVLLLKPEQVETVGQELAAVGLRIGVLHHGIRNIRACCGALCSFAQGTHAIELALKLDEALYGRPMKFDVKIAVSDCLRNCMESYCVDIGLVAVDGKYNIYVGGVASTLQLSALKLVDGVATPDVLGLVEKILTWYDERAVKGERLYKTLERIGQQSAETVNTDAFAGAGAVFNNLGTPLTSASIIQTLTRSLTRALAVRQMRIDLGLI
ncbi:MAG: hypothetical protein HQK55_11345 [Deltaproteobacteria bacterium]|nr:hypothetical protein [Deltaproteobacteria bacterium]